MGSNSTLGVEEESEQTKLVAWNDIVDMATADSAMLVLSLFLAIAAVTFLTFYLSRVVGWVMTLVLKWRYGALLQGEVSLGSLTVSLLSGKVMVRDLRIITSDFSLRIQDGWLIFRYWKMFTPIKLGSDLSRLDARVLLQLNGLEFHQYNRLARYAELDRLFHVGLLPEEAETPAKDVEEEEEFAWEESMRGLIPVVAYEISSARLLFGNHSLPATLLVRLDNAIGTYTSKPPSTSKDWFMHSVSGVCDNFRAELVRSSGYEGTEWEEPPRKMGAGFVLLQTAELEYFHNQDRLGRVKESEQDFTDTLGPIWATDLRLGHNTVLSYGPWADKHREKLYNFFFPSDYQNQRVTPGPSKGESRSYVAYSLGVVTLYDAALDVQFMRGEEPNALHLSFSAGSSLEMSLPWIVAPTGFVTTVKGVLMRPEVATSLEYRQLLEAETLAFEILMRYPLAWDGLQTWDFSFSAGKTTAWIVYSVKTFVQEMLDEWAGTAPANAARWVPYRWNVALQLHDFEIILLLNAHNWIDTSSQNEENIQAAVRGAELDLTFSLPFDRFLPLSLETRLALEASRLELALFIPPQYVMSSIYGNLEAASREMQTGLGETELWAKATSEDRGWSTLWWAPSVLASFDYVFHQMHDQLPIPDVPELTQDIMPMHDFDAQQLNDDIITVNVELGPSTLRFCGLIIKYLMNFKENYLGMDQEFRDVAQFTSQEPHPPYGQIEEEKFDGRSYRPLRVECRLALGRIEAHAMLYDGLEDETGKVTYPVAVLPSLIFEMDKRHEETELQLCLSPVTLTWPGIPDSRLCLSAFQFRGHAMFSDADIPCDSPTLEYAWLVELVVGEVSGSVDPRCLWQTAQLLETLLAMLLLGEDNVPAPLSLQLCQHQAPTQACPRADTGSSGACRGEEALKYKVVRLSVDALSLALRDGPAGVLLQTEALRLATCTLHAHQAKDGLSLRLPTLSLRFLLHPQLGPSTAYHQDMMEVGHVRLNGSSLEVALPSSPQLHENMLSFLRLHDRRTERLYFLWNENDDCGCLGNCEFYGDNEYGSDFLTELRLLGDIRKTRKGSKAFMQSLLHPHVCLLADDTSSPVSVGDAMCGGSEEEEFFLAREKWEKQPPTPGSQRSAFSFQSTRSRLGEEEEAEAPLLVAYQGVLDAYRREEDSGHAYYRTRVGLNEAALEADPFKADTRTPDAHHRRLQRWVSGQEAKARLHPPHQLTLLEVEGEVAERVGLLLTPLAGLVVRRMVKAVLTEAAQRSPAHLLQGLFRSCSAAAHRQPLNHIQKSEPPVLCAKVGLPRLDFQALLCTKGSENARVETMLFSSCVLATSLSAHSHLSDEAAVGGGQVVLVTASAEAAFGQLLLVQPAAGSTPVGGGISRNASRIPYYADWSRLEGLATPFVPCVVLETGVQRVAARANLALGEHWTLPAQLRGGQQDAAKKVDVEDETAESEIIVDIGPILCNFALLQSIEDEGWPLYDLLSPVLSAWLRSAHSLISALGEGLDDLQMRRSLSVAWLLTLALDGQEESPPRSRVGPAKSGWAALRSCPSCQLILSLLRFTQAQKAPKEHIHVLQEIQDRDDLDLRQVNNEQESPPRSRVGPAKSGWAALRSCPSCQLILSLLLFTQAQKAPKEHIHVLQEIQDRDDLDLRQVNNEQESPPRSRVGPAKSGWAALRSCPSCQLILSLLLFTQAQKAPKEHIHVLQEIQDRDDLDLRQVNNEQESPPRSRVGPAKSGWAALRSCPSCQLILSLLLFTQAQKAPKEHIHVLQEIQDRDDLDLRQVNNEQESPPRSRVGPAKSGWAALRSCPSCQLILSLLLFTQAQKAPKEHIHVLQEIQDRDDLDLRQVQKGLVSLLSHWRTVLCADNLVRLRTDVAEHFLPKESKITPFKADESRIQMDEQDGDGETGAAGEWATLLAQDEAVTPGSEPSGGSGGSGEGKSGSGGGRSRRSGGGRSGRTAAASREDLYAWMQQQQKAAREADSNQGPLGSRPAEVNPMDLPLNVYFAPLYKTENLELQRPGVPLLQLFGGSMSCRFHLKELKVGTIEPKILTMISYRRKKVGYTERHLIGFESVEVKSLLKFEPEKVGGGVFACRRWTLHVNYHVQCDKTLVTVGFPSASAVSQLKSLAKGVLDEELSLRAVEARRRKRGARSEEQHV